MENLAKIMNMIIEKIVSQRLQVQTKNVAQLLGFIGESSFSLIPLCEELTNSKTGYDETKGIINEYFKEYNPEIISLSAYCQDDGDTCEKNSHIQVTIPGDTVKKKKEFVKKLPTFGKNNMCCYTHLKTEVKNELIEVEFSIEVENKKKIEDNMENIKEYIKKQLGIEPEIDYDCPKTSPTSGPQNFCENLAISKFGLLVLLISLLEVLF